MNEHLADPAHIAACADCQVRSSLEGLDVNLDRVWTEVSEKVWSRQAGRLEHVLRRVLRSPGLARALLTTPSLVLSWILATAAVLAAGAFFTYQSSTPWVGLLAPALAGTDPAWELNRTTVVSERMVLLVRSLAVFGVNAVMGLAASLVSDQALAVTFSWLVPMTTVSAIALAAATWARSAPVGVGTGLMVWALVVVSTSRGFDDWGNAVRDQRFIPIYAVATAVLIGVALYGARNTRREVSQWQ